VRRIDDLAREDDLVADLYADLAMPAEVERARPRTGQEVERTGNQPRRAERLEQPAQREILAVWDQVRLGVRADYRARIIERGDRVVCPDRATILDLQVDRAGHQRAVLADGLPKPSTRKRRAAE